VNLDLKRAARSSLKYRTQKIAKKLPSRHHCTILSGYMFATKVCIDSWNKNLLNCITFSTSPRNVMNFGPLTAEIFSGVRSTRVNFNGFRILAALLHSNYWWASAKLCGIEQRAPSIFCRAAITLGIGPHSSFSIFFTTTGSIFFTFYSVTLQNN